jgi:hypothetical protein
VRGRNGLQDEESLAYKSYADDKVEPGRGHFFLLSFH